jgi:putative transposase
LGKRYWGKHFWSIGHAAFSSGHATDEMIQEYLKHHKNHPNHQDDDFLIE